MHNGSRLVLSINIIKQGSSPALNLSDTSLAKAFPALILGIMERSNGLGLEVAYIVHAHSPWARTQSHGPTYPKSAGGNEDPSWQPLPRGNSTQ